MRLSSSQVAGSARKLLFSAAALSTAGGMAALGTFATFTDTETGSTAVDTGVVSISVGTDGTSANRLSVAATDIVPGDTIERAVNLSIDASTTDTPASLTLTTTGSSSNALTTDTTNGLKLEISKCSVAWTESGSQPYTYTCSGTTSSVLASRAVIGSDLTLSNLALSASSTNYLVVKLTLPSSAGNTFQNLSNTINYSFTATQRAASAQ